MASNDTIRVLVMPSPEELAGLTTQKDRAFPKPGEYLVLDMPECGGSDDKRDVCGCGRAFCGIDGRQMATIGKVTEIGRAEFRALFMQSGLLEKLTMIGPETQWRQNVLCLSSQLETFQLGDLVRVFNRPSPKNPMFTMAWLYGVNESFTPPAK